jgi:luciferase family oxidoreductase group 1
MEALNHEVRVEAGKPVSVIEAGKIPLSILDLAPVKEGQTSGEALRESLDLAQHAERLGYNRYWVAEHHNRVGYASAATSVVLGFLAGGTSTIMLGSGGIMLPNHSPMLIAEQFGTLESLYPGRIELGLGRSTGTDLQTLRALRRSPAHAKNFKKDVLELQALLGPVLPGQAVKAIPGGGSDIPLWILGSSLSGAQLAGALGLPYAFASHFVRTPLPEALKSYRENFQPSPGAHVQRPHVMIGVNVVAAD